MTAGVHVITWIMSCHLSLRHLLPRRSYSSVSLAPSVTTCHPPYFWGAVENNGRGGGGTFQFVAGQNTTPGVVVAPDCVNVGERNAQYMWRSRCSVGQLRHLLPVLRHLYRNMEERSKSKWQFLTPVTLQVKN